MLEETKAQGAKVDGLSQSGSRALLSSCSGPGLLHTGRWGLRTKARDKASPVLWDFVHMYLQCGVGCGTGVRAP